MASLKKEILRSIVGGFGGSKNWRNFGFWYNLTWSFLTSNSRAACDVGALRVEMEAPLQLTSAELLALRFLSSTAGGLGWWMMYSFEDAGWVPILTLSVHILQWFYHVLSHFLQKPHGICFVQWDEFARWFRSPSWSTIGGWWGGSVLGMTDA